MIIIIVSISLLLGILGTVGFFLMLGTIDKTPIDPQQLQNDIIPNACPFKQTNAEGEIQTPLICPYCKKQDNPTAQ